MTKTIFVTGMTSGFDRVIAHALADAGHVVYVGAGATGDVPGPADDRSTDHGPGQKPVELRTVPFDPIDQQSVAAAVRQIHDEAGAIDVVVHAAAPATLGPTEAFTPYQLGQLYDITVLSMQRVHRAVLPRMRERGKGLLVYTGPPAELDPSPFVALGQAVGAALHQLARSYATELAPLGIDVTFLTYGVRPAETDCPWGPLAPADTNTADAYKGLASGPTPAGEQPAGEQRPFPAALAEDVGRAVVGLVGTAKGERPFHLPVGRPGAPGDPGAGV